MASINFPVGPNDTALLVIDMQNDFCHQPVRGPVRGDGVPTVTRIIPNVMRLAALCREADLPIFWSRQIHFPNDVTRQRHKIPAHLDKGGFYPCMPRTPGAEIIDELKENITPKEFIFEKHRFSCFYNTTLESKLRMLGITTLIISGVASSHCVETTVRDAYIRDYDVIVVKECIGNLSDSDEADRLVLDHVDRIFGLTVTLEELTEAFVVPAVPSGIGAGRPTQP